MARFKRKITEEPKAYQPATAGGVAAANAPVNVEMNKQAHDQAMAKIVAPEILDEPERVTFFGTGSIVFTVVDEKTNAKRNYGVEFGPHFQYSTANPIVIKLLRDRGYKEK